MGEIVECSMRACEDRRQRAASIRNRKWDGWNALLEKTTRSVLKLAVESPIKIATGRQPRRRSANAVMNVAAAAAAVETRNASPILFVGEECNRNHPQGGSRSNHGIGSSSNTCRHKNLPHRGPILKSPERRVMRFDGDDDGSKDKNPHHRDIVALRELPLSMEIKEATGTHAHKNRREQLWRSHSVQFPLQE
jgi:hypothetical protein